MTAIEPAYGYAEAAAKLQALGYDISENWLRQHPEVPRIKVGRAVQFTDSLLTEFLAAKTQRLTTTGDTLRPASRRR
jgi:phage gp29-like protein